MGGAYSSGDLRPRSGREEDRGENTSERNETRTAHGEPSNEMMDLKRIRDGANWSDHPQGIVDGEVQGWQLGESCFHIASGLSMPSSANDATSSRNVTAAVARRNVLRAGFSSVRM